MKSTKWQVLGIKVWGNMLAAIIICFMLALFFGFDSVWVKLVLQAVDLFIFGGLIYRFFWKAGSTDSNKVELKMADKDVYKGIKAGVIASVPYLILWIALLAVKISGGAASADFLLVCYSFINVPFTPVINSIFFSFGGSFAATSVTSIALTLFTPIFVVAMSSVAYYLGYKQYIIMDHIIYKNPNKKS